MKAHEGREVKITTSKVFDMIRKSKAEIVVCEGSARSTKTYSLIQFLISLALENETRKKPESLRFIIMRQRLTWLKETVLVDFRTIMRDQFDIWDERKMNKQDSIYTLYNSSFIFSGLDYEGGQKFHGKKSDYAWFNEANEIDYPSVRQILLRLTKRAFFDYNPNFDDHHWIETKIKPRNDVEVIRSTYRDNPFLEQRVIDEIERLKPTPENIAQGTADEIGWKIYGLGLRGVMKGLVFRNFNIVPEFPKDAESVCYGLDFGYSNDPSSFIRKGEKNGELYFDEVFYERGLTNIENPKNPSQDNIERRFMENNIRTTDIIWADSAEPKSIADLAGCGFNIRGVKKGSVVDGLNTMMRYKINVTERSINLISELRKYKWVEDRSGEQTNTPIDCWNHCFTGDTMVLTNLGKVRICDIDPGKHKALTRYGHMPIKWARCTGKKQTYKIKLSNGEYLIGSAHHKIFTIDSVRYLINTNNTVIFHETQIEEYLSWYKRYCSTVTNIEGIPIRAMKAMLNIINRLIQSLTRGCTGQCGSIIMDRYQMVITYIIRMAIRTTMKLKISNACRQLSTPRGIYRSMIHLFQGWIMQENLQAPGTNQLKEGNGMSVTGRHRLQNHFIRASRHAYSVMENISVTMAVCMKNSVQGHAKQNTGFYPESTTFKSNVKNAAQYSQKTNMRRENIVTYAGAVAGKLIATLTTNLEARLISAYLKGAHCNNKCMHVVEVEKHDIENVYNMEVDGHHEYFANGVLVSNCIDAARYSVVASEISRVENNARYDSCRPRMNLIEW